MFINTPVLEYLKSNINIFVTCLIRVCCITRRKQKDVKINKNGYSPCVNIENEFDMVIAMKMMTTMTTIVQI